MEPKFDISSTTPFAFTLELERAATTQDEHGLLINVSQQFVTTTGQPAMDMSLDLLTSVPLRTVMALSGSQEEEPELVFLAVSAVALGGRYRNQGTCRPSVHHMRTSGVLYSNQRGSFDRLQHAYTFLVLPSSPTSSAMLSDSPLDTEEKRGRPSKGKGASSVSVGSDQRTPFFTFESHDMELGLLRMAITLPG